MIKNDKDQRRVTYKLYPTAAQAARMEYVRGLHRQLYNAALQERTYAWRVAGVSITYARQCRSLNAQVTLKRLDLAYAAFLPPGADCEIPAIRALSHATDFLAGGMLGDGFTLQG